MGGHPAVHLGGSDGSDGDASGEAVVHAERRGRVSVPRRAHIVHDPAARLPGYALDRELREARRGHLGVYRAVRN